MSNRSHIRCAGVLRRRHERLKLYVLDTGRNQIELDADLVRRLVMGLAIDTPSVTPIAGFAVFSSLDDPLWRCAIYLWSDGGLSRSVMIINLQTRERHRAPDAAFHVGCEDEIQLIAGELHAWRSARIGRNALERYLETAAS